MAGVLTPLIPKRTYTFNTLQVGTTQTFDAVERIDISQHVDAALIVRVHSVVTSGGQIRFSLYGDGYTEEDPGTRFRTKPVLMNYVQMDNSIVAPKALAGGAEGAAKGHFAALQIYASRSAAYDLNATVSIDLLLRSPDDSTP